jgi:hypothetical protein
MELIAGGSRAQRRVVAPVRRRVEDVGVCALCGVRCAGQPQDHERLRRMLVGHERFCPGGDRHGERWLPFELPLTLVSAVR